ncbi:MAG: transposase [Myxococcota bacterium]
MTNHTHGSHIVYYHRYHIIWSTKYRYKILRGPIAYRARDVIAQVCEKLGVEIVTGVVSNVIDDYISHHNDAHRQDHVEKISLENYTNPRK